MATNAQLPVLIDERRILGRVGELATAISADYERNDLHVVGVLRGAYQFTRDLSKRLAVAHTVDFISVASYGGGMESSGALQLRMDLTKPIAGKDVLLVDDIVDTGLTMTWLLDYLKAREARSVRTCFLLDKPSRRRVWVRTDYIGFPIDDLFVVGYGLDYQEKFRELPFISSLSPERVLV